MSCVRCGLCCNTYPIDISYTDILRWDEDGCKQILREVSLVDNYPSKGYAGFYFEKTLRSPKQPCPFLTEGKTCSIYSTRPMVCRDFPKVSDARCCCPEYGLVETSSLKKQVMRQDQARDLKKALKHYKELMGILVKARG